MKYIVNIVLALLSALVLQAKEIPEIVITDQYQYGDLAKDIEEMLIHNGTVMKEGGVIVRKNNEKERIRIEFFPKAEHMSTNARRYFCCFTGGGVYVAELVNPVLHEFFGFFMYRIVEDLQWMLIEDFQVWLDEVKRRHSTALRNVTIIFWAPLDFNLHQNWAYFRALLEMKPCHIDLHYPVFVFGSKTRPPICPSVDRKIAEEILHELGLFATQLQAARENESMGFTDDSPIVRRLNQYAEDHPVEFLYTVACSGGMIPEEFLH